MKAKLGIAPIAWWNDDLAELSDDVSLEECLRQASVGRLASHGYEGWFVVEAEQDPKVNPPLEMAKKGHAELLRVIELAGYEVMK